MPKLDDLKRFVKKYYQIIYITFINYINYQKIGIKLITKNG